ncbi:transcriptional regulator [Sphaerisporangium krabiense]|uniref:Transcriptional regulator with XRE-family HTH domain n=1 Tax=Sphaerisporangium krabiense TaxID=763782 RepID=A0A7W9DTQ1_9ACTN|nr:helix-turn-helix transcriptional regulator [Sphaerisporangium krabiense]MBB5630833.1 transcriptional regulator with XRE-family HTH domain [Sphaerisporangium krabiense]GII65484.1 transcriptional regulator [Sphaerisporangium krabiense]
MNRFPAEGDLDEDQVIDHRRAGPTVLRMLVGAELRRLREAAGVTRARAGYEIRASDTKISRLELGRTGFKPRDVQDLLTLYGVTDDAEREPLLVMARQASMPGWWHAYADVTPASLESYIGLEQGAAVIRTWDPLYVPELLQTEDYARALVQALNRGAAEAENERRVALRMRRARILTDPGTVTLWAVLDESALRRRVGGTATMRGQLRHLIEAAALPNVTIHVLPFSHGAHGAMGGPIAIMRPPATELSDVVCLPQLVGTIYPDRQADVDRYYAVMNALVVDAESAAGTVRLLEDMLKEY